MNNVKIVDLLKTPNNRNVNLNAIIYDVGPPQTFTCHDQKNRNKQNIQLVDDTMKIVTLGVWSEFLHKLDGCEGKSYTFQNVSIREFRGKKQLSSISNTAFEPLNHPESFTLDTWWNDEDQASEFEELILPSWNATQEDTMRKKTTQHTPTRHKRSQHQTRTITDRMKATRDRFVNPRRSIRNLDFTYERKH